MDDIIRALERLKEDIMLGKNDVLDQVNDIIVLCNLVMIPEPSVSEKDFAGISSEPMTMHIENATINIYPPLERLNPDPHL